MNKILGILIVILLVVATVWYFNGGNEAPVRNNDDTEQSPTTNNPPPRLMDEEDEDATEEDSTDLVVEEIPNAFQGELQASNDTSRGNLMILLENSDRIIYLNTSRDYSSLIGEDVIVTIDGSMDDFILVDIKPRQ